MEDERRQFGEFVIDGTRNTVTSSAGSQQVPARVMDVLLYLMKHRDRVVSTDELLSTFWEGRIVEESTIHRIISQIRSALGDSARNPRYIRTVSKRGYQAVAEVGSVPDTDSITTAATADIPAPPRGSTSPSRRHILLGASALALAILGLVLLWQSPTREAGPSEADTMAGN